MCLCRGHKHAILMLVFKKHVDILFCLQIWVKILLKKFYRTSSPDARFEMMESGSFAEKKSRGINKILMEFLIGWLDQKIPKLDQKYYGKIITRLGTKLLA